LLIGSFDLPSLQSHEQVHAPDEAALFMTDWHSQTFDHKNPYAAPRPVHEPVVDKFDTGRSWWAVVASVLQLITVCVGVPIAWFNIESILFSGPIVSILGLLTTILAIRARSGNTLLLSIFGLSGPAISVGTFALIAYQEWSPSDAQEPVSMLLIWYVLIVVPMGLVCVFGRQGNSSVAETAQSPDNAEPSSGAWLE